jgi:hypothetical protein
MYIQMSCIQKIKRQKGKKVCVLQLFDLSFCDDNSRFSQNIVLHTYYRNKRKSAVLLPNLTCLLGVIIRNM